MATKLETDDIPTDAEVVDAIGTDPLGKSASDVLQVLLAGGHTRANSQRAIQRVLDRGKVQYNRALNLTVVPVEQDLAA